jgi:hypothetical protein
MADDDWFDSTCAREPEINRNVTVGDANYVAPKLFPIHGQYLEKSRIRKNSYFVTPWQTQPSKNYVTGINRSVRKLFLV